MFAHTHWQAGPGTGIASAFRSLAVRCWGPFQVRLLIRNIGRATDINGWAKLNEDGGIFLFRLGFPLLLTRLLPLRATLSEIRRIQVSEIHRVHRKSLWRLRGQGRRRDVHTFYPEKCDKIFPFFLPKFSPFWRPQVGIESVSEMANIFPLFLPKFSPFWIHFLSPFLIPYLSPFPINFYPRFRYPFYPRFRYPFYPRVRYPFYPCFR